MPTPAAAAQAAVNPFDLPEAGKAEIGEEYWIGTLPSCPHRKVAVGGVMFHDFTDPPTSTDRETGVTQRDRMNGCIERLTPAQLTRIYEALKKKVVRWAGKDEEGDKRRVGFIRNTNLPGFVIRSGDQPLAKHLYLTPVASLTDPRWNKQFPPSIYDTAREKVESEKPTRK